MKKHIHYLILAISTMFFASCASLNGIYYSDDIYYNPSEDEKVVVTPKKDNAQIIYDSEAISANENQEMDNDEYYDDYEYANRLRRFHDDGYQGAYYDNGRPNIAFNFGYNPYAGSYWGIGLGWRWGWNYPYYGHFDPWYDSFYAWNSPFYYNSWYRPHYYYHYGYYHPDYYHSGYYLGGTTEKISYGRRGAYSTGVATNDNFTRNSVGRSASSGQIEGSKPLQRTSRAGTGSNYNDYGSRASLSKGTSKTNSVRAKDGTAVRKTITYTRSSNNNRRGSSSYTPSYTRSSSNTPTYNNSNTNQRRYQTTTRTRNSQSGSSSQNYQRRSSSSNSYSTPRRSSSSGYRSTSTPVRSSSSSTYSPRRSSSSSSYSSGSSRGSSSGSSSGSSNQRRR